VETAFSDFDLNSRDDWEAVIKAAGGLKIHVKVLSAKVADSNPAPATIQRQRNTVSPTLPAPELKGHPLSAQ